MINLEFGFSKRSVPVKFRSITITISISITVSCTFCYFNLAGIIAYSDTTNFCSLGQTNAQLTIIAPLCRTNCTSSV